MYVKGQFQERLKVAQGQSTGVWLFGCNCIFILTITVFLYLLPWNKPILRTGCLFYLKQATQHVFCVAVFCLSFSCVARIRRKIVFIRTNLVRENEIDVSKIRYRNF